MIKDHRNIGMSAKPLLHLCCYFYRNHHSHLGDCEQSVSWAVEVTFTLCAAPSTESRGAIGLSFSPNAQKSGLTVRSREHKFMVFDLDVWKVRSCGICGGQSGNGGRFSPSTSGFPCQFSFHLLLHTHLLSSGAGTTCQSVADVPSGLSDHDPNK
jgi:hypothetical protein